MPPLNSYLLEHLEGSGPLSLRLRAALHWPLETGWTSRTLRACTAGLWLSLDFIIIGARRMCVSGL